jgi:hypothetical protein
MSRNSLYLAVGVLMAVVVGLGLYIYNEQTRPGLEVRVDGQGISIEGNS